MAELAAKDEEDQASAETEASLRSSLAVFGTRGGPRSTRLISSATFVAGLGVSFVLFVIMHFLIAEPKSREQRQIVGRVVDFIRAKDASAIETKRRKPPQKMQEEAPPPPELDMPMASRPTLGDDLGQTVSIPTFQMEGVGLGGVAPPSDMDVVPLVRIDQNYPRRAQQLGIEGWVLLEFTITPAGTVKDVVVLDSDPPGIFDREGIRAVSRYRYRPRIENGVPIERKGVQIVLEWQLED